MKETKQQAIDRCDRQYKARLASLGGAWTPPPQAQARVQVRASARLPTATPRQSTRSEFGLRCLSGSYFDPSKPRRMIEGKLLSGSGTNANGAAFSAAGMKASLPMPLMFSHSRPVGRVLFVHSQLDGSITFHAEIANTKLRFADDLWDDVSTRKIDSVSLGGQTLTGVTTGTIEHWTLTEISVALLGADPGATLTRVYEKIPGEFIGLHQPTREIWSGPITYWDDVNMGPRATDPPPQKTESPMAVACSLSTQRRAELTTLRAA